MPEVPNIAANGPLEAEVIAAIIKGRLGMSCRADEGCLDAARQILAALSVREAQEAEVVLAAFNGGMVRVADDRNPRGYVTYYRPLDAMRAALAYKPRACAVCCNTGWVCENHPDKPWSGSFLANENACGCGAGMPCSYCSKHGVTAALNPS